jgi:hypothetical protein
VQKGLKGQYPESSGFRFFQVSYSPLSLIIASFIIYFVCTLFLILPCSQHDEEENSLTNTNMCGTDEQPKTAGEKAFFVKDDKIYNI